MSLRFKNCISDGEFLRNDYFPKVIEIEYNCDIMDILLKVWMATMWRIQKLFNSDMGDTGRGVGFSYEEVFEMCQAADTHIAENIVMILSYQEMSHFLSQQKKQFFLARRNCSASFLVHVKVSAEECKTCGASPIVFINIPSTLEQLLRAIILNE